MQEQKTAESAGPNGLPKQQEDTPLVSLSPAARAVLYALLWHAAGLAIVCWSIVSSDMPTVGIVLGTMLQLYAAIMRKMQTPGVLPSALLHVSVVVYLAFAQAGWCRTACGALDTHAWIFGVSTTTLGILAHGGCAIAIMAAALRRTHAEVIAMLTLASWLLIGVSLYFATVLMQKQVFCGSCVAAHAAMFAQAICLAWVHIARLRSTLAQVFPAYIFCAFCGYIALYAVFAWVAPQPESSAYTKEDAERALRSVRQQEQETRPDVSRQTTSGEAAARAEQAVQSPATLGTKDATIARLFSLAQQVSQQQIRQLSAEHQYMVQESEQAKLAYRILFASLHGTEPVSPEAVEWARRFLEQDAASPPAQSQPLQPPQSRSPETAAQGARSDFRALSDQNQAYTAPTRSESRRGTGREAESASATRQSESGTRDEPQKSRSLRPKHLATSLGKQQAPLVLYALIDPHCPACAKQVEHIFELNDLLEQGQLRVVFHIVYPTSKRQRISESEEQAYQAAATVMLAAGLHSERAFRDTVRNIMRQQSAIRSPSDVLRMVPEYLDPQELIELIQDQTQSLQDLLLEAHQAQILRRTTATPHLWMRRASASEDVREFSGFQSASVLRLAVQTVLASGR